MSTDAPGPQAVTVAVTKAPLPEDFTVPRVVALARDLAMDMYEEVTILKKHTLSPEQYATLKDVPYFQKVVAQMAEEWNAPKNAQQRLAIQSAVGLEEVLPDVIARTKGRNEPLQGIAQLIKVLADMAGASGLARQPAAAGEKFKITINLGADTEVYNKTKPAITIEPNFSEGLVPEVQPLAQGFGALLTLQTEPEKA